jgi:lipopolysaccharide transport system ATP-binding protein
VRRTEEATVEGRGDLALRARDLGKIYHVYTHPADRLKQMFWPGRKKFYREFVAVRGVDLDIMSGETVGIVGRNGSGKSTLLRLICGTLERSSGELDVRGHIAPILTLGAGFNPEFTGRENVILNATILGLERREIKERLQSIIDFAAIGDYFDQPVKTYSSGMYSRLAFAVAINADPDILVVDEVLAVGDEAFIRKCFARIEEIKKQGSTILFVSHSSASVIELCDRAILLEDGERLLTADPKTVVSWYHKLLYSPPDQGAQIADEIRALDGASKAGADSGVEAANETEEGESLGHFDPNLQPESTVEYGDRTAMIRDVRILDANGREVNVLRRSHSYTFAYEVDFEEAAEFVRFGMMFKLPTGFELAGQASHSAMEAIEKVPAGACAALRFQFRTDVTPGVYFMNAGVLAIRDGEETYLHRILDAFMCRVDLGDVGDVGDVGIVTGVADLTTGQPAEVTVKLRENS